MSMIADVHQGSLDVGESINDLAKALNPLPQLEDELCYLLNMLRGDGDRVERTELSVSKGDGQTAHLPLLIPIADLIRFKRQELDECRAVAEEAYRRMQQALQRLKTFDPNWVEERLPEDRVR